MSRRLTQAAADVSVAGIDPTVYLRADTFERMVLREVARRRHELEAARDDALAVRIANAVGKLFSD